MKRKSFPFHLFRFWMVKFRILICSLWESTLKLTALPEKLEFGPKVRIKGEGIRLRKILGHNQDHCSIMMSECYQRDFNIVTFRQTSDSSWEFLKIENVQLETVQNNCYGRLCSYFAKARLLIPPRSSSSSETMSHCLACLVRHSMYVGMTIVY